VAWLPAGRPINAQRNESASPSASDEAPPSSVTVSFTTTRWSGPALATGLLFCVLIVTVSAALSTVPSFTINCATYVPDTSTTNVGFDAAASERIAPLPSGFERIDHANVNGSAFGSLDALPSNCTVAPCVTV